MMIFNVETHGDIRFCPICRRYIVTIANSPHPVARPRINENTRLRAGTERYRSAHFAWDPAYRMRTLYVQYG